MRIVWHVRARAFSAKCHEPRDRRCGGNSSWKRIARGSKCVARNACAVLTVVDNYNVAWRHACIVSAVCEARREVPH
jgi:hypothetical protein